MLFPPPNHPSGKGDLFHVTVSGIPVAVETVRNGSNPTRTLAWVHGLGSSSTIAFAQAARHPALHGVTSLLIDVPGHGASAKPDDWTYTVADMAGIVQETLKRQADAPVALFGHSMGGSIAIECAAGHSGTVERLIVAEPNLRAGTGVLSAHIAAQSESAFVQHGYPALVRLTRRQAAAGDRGAAQWLRALLLASPVALYRCSVSLQTNRTPTFRDQLEGLAIPVATISGEFTPPLQPPLTHPDLKGYVVRNAGHAMMAENPDGFARAVATALGSGRSPSPSS